MSLEETIKAMKYDDKGLLTAVIVDAATKEVLMVAFMNDKALIDTVRTGKTHFWSRSRQKYWMKGEESGHTQDVQAIYVDCDQDCVVVEVVQHGAACHEGYRSCFFRRLNGAGQWEVCAKQLLDPKQIYKKKP
ncbi:MAG: phosphoribosyl-AMP cyclohydrolase [Phycisphaerae bacterium]